MNDRGQYGRSTIGPRGSAYCGRFVVGSQLQHVIELTQRYERVNAAGAQALLNGLSTDGVISSTGANRWEVALKDGNFWVRLDWDPGTSVLQVMITDKHPHSIDQVRWIRSYFEKILREKITPRLSTYGAVTVGITLYHSVGDCGRHSRALSFSPCSGVYVGQGSYLGHTPGEVEDELNHAHGEMMCFAQEVIELTKKLEAQTGDEVKKLRDEEAAAWKVVDSFKPLVDEVERIKKQLSTTKNPALVLDLGKAQTALDAFMSPAKRREAIQRARDLSDRRSMLEHEVLGRSPVIEWARSTWRPFFDGWLKFYSEKKDIPLQTLPGSGVWDRVQEYRQQFIDLRKNAPFKSTCPEPLDPSKRRDPSFTDVFKNIGSILKWTLIGALGIGGAVALASVASNVRKGRDPVEHYVGLYRGRKAA